MHRWSILGTILLVAACDNPCEQFGDVVEAKARQCGMDSMDPGEPTEEQECTEEDAEFATCAIPCYRDAECEAIDGTDMEASMALLACIGECVQEQQP
jgi:hypothetical protein